MTQQQETANRLLHETSPYLRQHAHNPVDWYPWGPEVARILNEHFVSIKVDREERPDLDQIYMAAVQLMTGQGGWPMSVFLTPDLKPFYGGTYFPPDDRYGRPGV